MRSVFLDRAVLFAPDRGAAHGANKEGNAFNGRQCCLQPAAVFCDGPDVDFLEAAWASLSALRWFPVVDWWGPQPNPIGL